MLSVYQAERGDASKEHKKRQLRNHLVYNDWDLYGFVRMLTYTCLHAEKELHIISEHHTTKRCSACGALKAMPLWQRRYRCVNENCGLVIDRDEHSAINLYQRSIARLESHTL